jgi:hypothetical protein
MRDITKLLNAVMIATEMPITKAGFNCEVTAREEHIPNTWTAIGLSRFKGLVKASLFSFENSVLIF